MYLWKRKTPINFGSHPDLDPEFRIWEIFNFSHQCGWDRDNSTHYAKTTGAIFTKFSGKMAHVPRKKRLIFYDISDPDPRFSTEFLPLYS